MADLLYRSGWLDPYREMRRFQDEVNRLFGTLAETRAGDFPAMNLWAGDDGVLVTAELPGVDPDSVRITVHRNTLSLSGARRDEPPAPDAEPVRRERAFGTFSRTVTLPFLVDADRVAARTEAGLLEIRLPRPEADRPKRIAITA